MVDDKVSERAYYEAFRTRLRTMRNAIPLTQEKMAKALGVSLNNYKKYETAYAFPPHLLEQLAVITRQDIDFIVTGRNVRQLRPRIATRT